MALFIEKRDDLYRTIIYSNSPWIKDSSLLKSPEPFRREVFYRVWKEMHSPHGNAVLIKGPRRVGKTEIQKQIMWDLVKVENVDTQRILYITFDDVQIQSERPEIRARMVFDILNTWAQILGYETYDEIAVPAYLFLDEVQAVSDWAILVKNRVERNQNVRIVLSGSAAHSIFEKSTKILLGRAISEKLTTFSFREFLNAGGFLSKDNIEQLQEIQRQFELNLSPSQLAASLKLLMKDNGFDENRFRIHITDYLNHGGFPQLWKYDPGNLIEKAHLIDENYVKKVTLEDLMLLQQIKKPELYERLLRHLFARPGQEYNQNKIASDLGTTAVTLADAMKLLEQTDLLIFVERFSQKAEPLKRRSLKIYPIDMILTFAMTKIQPSLEVNTDKGAIAESLVAQTLIRLRGISNIAYIRSEALNRAGELDFFVRADARDCPIEVKYQNQIHSEDIIFLKNIIKERDLEAGLLVNVDSWAESEKIFGIPLWAFMLIA